MASSVPLSPSKCTTNSTDYCSLEPGSLSSLGVPSLGFSSKTPMGLYDVTSTIITIMFVASVIAAVGRGIFGSFYLLEASEQGISKAKTIFREITFGLLGIFILFPLILLLNRQLLAGDVGVGLRSTSTSRSSVSTSAPTKPVSAPFIPSNNDDPSGWNAIKNDATVRQALAGLPNGGITVNKPVCVTPTQRGCTTVGGWPPETFTMLTQLRDACPTGTMRVSGGNEAGHSSHGAGKNPVDLSLRPPKGESVEACIREFPIASPLSFCYKAYTKFDFIFCDEISVDRHWHIYKPKK